MYNDLNPIGDGNTNAQLQVRVGQEIQNKQQYARIDGDIL